MFTKVTLADQSYDARFSSVDIFIAFMAAYSALQMA